jgi:glycerol-3-phosphate acyltransferase PlsX
MGGDHGPEEVVPGALAHARAHPEDQVILVGIEARLRSIAPSMPPNVTIVAASQVIEMDEHPAMALREKKDASILVACDLVRTGYAEAFLPAGNPCA